MSLTRDFEKRESSSWEVGYFYYDHDVESLLAHARALETMLKKHEWPDCDDGQYYPCVECGKLEYQGHAPDCQLAKLLEGVE